MDSVDGSFVDGCRVVDAGGDEREKLGQRSLPSADGPPNRGLTQKKGCNKNVQLATQYSFRSIPELLGP